FPGQNRASCGSNGNGYGYPASYSHVISVSSVGQANTHWDPTDGSGARHTHNDKVDLCAPGYSVLSLFPENEYGRSSGTSFASPITAGVVALLLNINPCLTFPEILTILTSTSNPISDENNFPAGHLGSGVIDAYQACLLAVQQSGVPSTVSGITSLTGNLQAYTDIQIEPGATLSISGVIEMSPTKKIIIKPGGKLVLDGGTLTNSACSEELWQGIEIWGNHNLPQTAANQGLLIVKNNALIENAENAVTVWKPSDWGTTGGIVEATNSTFRNNRRSIEFLAYQNLQTNGYIAPNRSYFKNCTFEINDDLPLGDIQGNSDMFTMHKVNGVGIYG